MLNHMEVHADLCMLNHMGTHAAFASCLLSAIRKQGVLLFEEIYQAQS